VPDALPPDPRDARRRLFVLLAATGSLSMIFVDITVTAIAGPDIGDAFGLGPSGVSWITNAYLVTLAALMAIGGRLGDLLGKRNAFLAGIATFAAASAMCGIATDASMLYAGRVLQGIGACLMQPAASALIIETFPSGERGRAMGISIGISMSFFALGPVIGGLLAKHAGWEWVFFVNLPIALAAITLALLSRAPNRMSGDRSFDFLSAALIVVGLPLAIYALETDARADEQEPFRLFQPAFLAMLGAGVLLTSLFAYRQLVVQRPLVHLRLFADARLRSNVLLIGIMQFAMASLVVQGSIYARDVLHYPSDQAGASLMPLLIPVILLARRAGKLYDQHGVRPLARMGTAVATTGLVVWGVGSFAERYAVIATGMALLGAGLAFIMSPANTDTLSRVPDEIRGQVSGLVQTVRQVGGAVGVAFAAAVSGGATALGEDLAHSIGWAILSGAAVSALGIIVALYMPRMAGAGRGMDARGSANLRA
jgi:EmrB/QacA subfamily drug resistance transporter